MREPDPIWAGVEPRRQWSERVLAQAPLLAAVSIAAGGVANIVATGWTYWNFAGPEGSLTSGERLRVALGAATSPVVAALLVVATLLALLPRLVAHRPRRSSGGTQAVLVALVVVQATYALGALVAVIDAFALFDPARRGRADIPFGQTGPTRVLRVVTMGVSVLGAALALAGRSQPPPDPPMNLDV